MATDQRKAARDDEVQSFASAKVMFGYPCALSTLIVLRASSTCQVQLSSSSL
jgi:hypothetical protein